MNFLNGYALRVELCSVLGLVHASLFKCPGIKSSLPGWGGAQGMFSLSDVKSNQSTT